MKTSQVSPPEPADASARLWTPQSRKRFVISATVALLAGLLIRLFFIARFSRITGDTLLYGDIAHNWLQHGIYGLSRSVNGLPAPPRATLIRLPGYPMFLGLCFLVVGYDHYGAVLLLQAAIDLGTCWIVAALARRLFGQRTGLIALWLGALCPFTANFVAMPLTETLTLFTIAVAFYALFRWQQAGRDLNRWLYCIAAALSYSILLRPEQGILAASVVPAILVLSFKSPAPLQRRTAASLFRTALPTAIVSLLTVLPLVPWTIRNERTFHVFQPLAPRFATDPGEFISYGFQRWYRTWAIDFASTETTYWNWDSDHLQIGDLPNRAFDSNAQYAATDALYNEYNLTTTASSPIDARFDALAANRIHADPIRYYLALPLARLFNMALRPRVDFLPMPLEWWKFRVHPRSTVFSYGYGCFNLAYFALAAAAVSRRRIIFPRWPEEKPLLGTMLATIFLRSILLLTIDNSEPRYTLEFFPVLFVMAAAQLGRLRPWSEVPTPAQTQSLHLPES